MPRTEDSQAGLSPLPVPEHSTHPFGMVFFLNVSEVGESAQSLELTR